LSIYSAGKKRSWGRSKGSKNRESHDIAPIKKGDMNMVRFFVARTLVEIAKAFSKLAIKIAGYGHYEINIELILKPLRNDQIDAILGSCCIGIALVVFWILTI